MIEWSRSILANEHEETTLQNLRSFSVDSTTGIARYGVADTRNDPERYLHVLVPSHMVDRFETLFVPRLAK